MLLLRDEAINQVPSNKCPNFVTCSMLLLQLRDEYNNPVPQEGVPTTLQPLDWATDSEPASGTELPQVEVSEGQQTVLTDARGRAYFGSISIVQGSGRVSRGTGSEEAAAVECQLSFAAEGFG